MTGMDDQRDSVATPATTELEADIAAQRERLAETVDALSHKLDVKAQARARLDALRRGITPAHIAAFAGSAVLVGTLVWWRRTR